MGDVRWSRSVRSGSADGMPSLFSMSRNTIIANDIYTSKAVHGLNIYSGEKVWSLECADLSNFDCSGDNTAGGYMALASNDGGVFFYSPKPGYIVKASTEVIIETPTDSTTAAPSQSPPLTQTTKSAGFVPEYALAFSFAFIICTWCGF